MSTIWRVLKARGFITPQPHKRPKSSYIRFEAEVANECWQADVTHVVVACGVVLEVLNVMDDHSRLCVASRAFVHTRSTDVVRTCTEALVGGAIRRASSPIFKLGEFPGPRVGRPAA